MIAEFFRECVESSRYVIQGAFLEFSRRQEHKKQGMQPRFKGGHL